MIKVTSLTKGYHLSNVFEDINFTINPGEFAVITGNNGIGKSTLLKCMLGIENIQAGTIEYGGTDIKQFDFAKYTGYVEQKEQTAIDMPLTVHEYLNIYSNNHDEVSQMFGVDKFHNVQIRHLSGGQWQKLKLARALLKGDLRYLFLDEPTNGIDQESTKEINHHLAKLSKQGVTIIMVSHSHQELIGVTKIIEFQAEGKICCKQV